MKKVDTERTLVLGDTHFPFQDNEAIRCVLDFTKFIKPDRIILNGDIPDHYPLSRFSKEPDRILSLQEEVNMTQDFFALLRKTAPDAEIKWLEGNHEVRLRHFLIDKAPQLASLDDLRMPRLYRCDDYGIQYVQANNRGAFAQVGPIIVGHFDIVRKDSGATAKALVTSKFSSVIQAHTHRLGKYYVRASGKQFVGQEGGCLCSLEPEYLDDCNWQQGLSLIHKVRHHSRFHVQEVPIIEGEILYGSREF